jgi:hypothetical protein
MVGGPLRIYLCVALIGICSALSSCGDTPQSKLIDEVNAAKIKARNLGEEGDRKRTEARQKSESGDKAEHDRLIQEAANIYGHVADTLNEAAGKTDELAKVKRPEWYQEYFGLHAKLTRNLARLAAGAHDELLMRLSGLPNESLVQSWKESLSQIGKENDDLRTKITAIEKRERIVLITE